MEILPRHYYDMIMRAGGHQRAMRCFDLNVQELSSEESSQYKPETEKDTRMPTHIIIFRDVEHTRSYTGWIKEDTEKKLVFEMEMGKECEFRPMVAPQ